MNIAKVYSAQLIGLSSHIVTIEVDLSNGLHAFTVVGLGDKAVDEAKDRISAAIKNSGFTSPKQKNQKVVISLAPADLRKEGTAFDLGMALGYLVACGEMDFDPEKKLFLGELSLEGKLRKTHGVLPLVRGAKELGFKEVYVPEDNAREAALVKGIDVYAVGNLEHIIGHLVSKKNCQLERQAHTKIHYADDVHELDFSLIKGQENAKRGLEIAAAGGHNIAMYGPPGTGKTMLAQAFRTLLPPLSYDEVLEVTGIHSMAQVLSKPFITQPPFRAPHHTASYPSLVGGGPFPKPGEITLAHHGVLFLDEFPEFEKGVIDALRQPLEDRQVTVSRIRGTLTFPAQCILIAAMNPCPCGYGKRTGGEAGGERSCSCTDRDMALYKKKISGPIIDRIDLWVSVHRVEYEKLSGYADRHPTITENSREIRKRIMRARTTQIKRFRRYKVAHKKLNSEMNVAQIEKIIHLSLPVKNLVTKSAERLGLSGRAFHRVLKVARTIADLDDSTLIEEQHILEALQYRQKS